MKRLLSASLAGLLCAVAGLGARAEPIGGQLHIYNWIEYLPKDVLEDFRQRTGIEVIYDIFDSPQTLEARLLTGNSGYDVAFPSSSQLPTLINSGAVLPLDRQQLPGWSHLDEKLMHQREGLDPGNRFAVPYLWGSTLIGYNKAKVEAVLGKGVDMRDYDLLFKPENIAKLSQCGVAILDSATEVFPIALNYLGLNPSSTNPADYDKATALLQSIRPYVRYFNSAKYPQDLANGDICVGVGWSGGVELARKLADAAGKGVKVQMFIPKEGVPMWSDVMVIPKNAPDRAEAQAFINYMRRPDVIAKASNAIGYPNPNKDATLLVDASIRDNPNMYVPQQQLGLLYPLEPIPMAIERIRTRTWTAVRSGN